MSGVIVCPECKKKMRAPASAKGKKVRCPGCSASFVAAEVIVDEGVRAGASAPPSPTAPVPPATPPAPATLGLKSPFDDDDEDDNPNPYGVGELDLSPRCPNCANEMESADAVICLFCGYNTQTRRLGETKKLVAHTHVDRFGWLMPGIACVAGSFLILVLELVYIFGLTAWTRGKDLWLWYLLNGESFHLWSVLIALGIIWGMGRFAHKRLMLEPTPPEIELD